jgi:plasmid stability protein
MQYATTPSCATQDPCYTDFVPNLTLSIDEELLRRARVRAARENTSVNAVVREYLADYAGARQMASARRRFVELSRSSSSGSGAGGRSWTRSELHDR